MKTAKRPLIALLIPTLFGLATATSLVGPGAEGAAPAEPQGPPGVVDILYARPFRLARGYPHRWRAEQPWVTSGYVLVLEVVSEVTVPRNAPERVLYVGAQTAERLNWGTGSGRVVALVPAPRGPDGQPALDWDETVAWYGSPELPERVDAARVAAEARVARDAGLAPLPAASVAKAHAAAGGLLDLEDRTALERFAAERVREFSPTESDWANGFLAPPVR